ncbi:MAG: DUF5789 family protein [Salinirussus sp.]
MSDDEDEAEAEPAVTLGDGPEVEGAPVARIAARFQWGREKSAIVAREGGTMIRTPDGPRPLEELLSVVDETYFPTRQAFIDAMHDAIGHGPVETNE